jgi:dTDP-4-dehydrorhamnose 3,5-epimerase
LENKVHEDERGLFYESYKDNFNSGELPKGFKIEQINNSRSNSGALRGIHFSKAEKGQAKLITCNYGSILDLVVDLRPNSATFLEFETVELNGFDGKAVYVPEGFGHAFLALANDTVVTYSLSSSYSPKHEFTIYPLDPRFKKVWGKTDFILSKRDKSGPTLEEILHQGTLN